MEKDVLWCSSKKKNLLSRRHSYMCGSARQREENGVFELNIDIQFETKRRRRRGKMNKHILPLAKLVAAMMMKTLRCCFIVPMKKLKIERKSLEKSRKIHATHPTRNLPDPKVCHCCRRRCHFFQQ